MPVVDTLVTKYVLDAEDYKAGARHVTQTTSQMGTSVFSMFRQLKSLTVVGMVTTALAAIPAALLGAGQAASAAGAEFEAQTKALDLYATSAMTTADMLAQLREVAKLPGLGNLEAMQSAVRLLAGGFDFTLSVRSMMAFGNALAAAGKGKEDLDGVIMALTQIAAKGKISAEEISQIAERVPQIRQAMKTAFGTANTEELQKTGMTAQTFILGVVAALEKLPKATGGMKNALSNLQDMFGVALADIGMGINKYLVDPLNDVARFGEYLKSLDVFSKIGEQMGQLFGGKEGGPNMLINLTALLVATLEELPKILGKVRLMIESVKDSFVAFYNKIANSRIGKLMGLDEIDPGPNLGMGTSIIFGKNIENIKANARKYAQGYAGYNPDPFTPGEGGSITGSENAAPEPQTELERQTVLLGAIERNTNPGRSSILGGGNLAAMGVTPVELGGIRRGRSKIDQVAQLLREIVSEESARSGASFLRTANPFIGSR